jgi:dihydroorotate dehydrogenase electron transfer subunit
MSAQPAGKAHRGTIFVEDGQVLEQHGFAAEQFVVRIRAPQCAATATPGSFVHLTCDPSVPMRRPLSIMRVDRKAGWFEVL